MLFYPVFAAAHLRSASSPSRVRRIPQPCRGGSPLSSSIPSNLTFQRSNFPTCQRSSNSFRMNTCKSVSKQTTLTHFRMNTYEKSRGWGVLLLTRNPKKDFCPEGASRSRDLSCYPLRRELCVPAGTRKSPLPGSHTDSEAQRLHRQNLQPSSHWFGRTEKSEHQNGRSKDRPLQNLGAPG
jgi:hypothetical protein